MLTLCRRLSARVRAWTARARTDPLLRDEARLVFGNAVRLTGIITLGISAGLYCFAPFSFHIYMKHYFPLLVFPLCLSKACILWIGVAAMTRSRSLEGIRRVLTALGGASLLVLSVLDHGRIQVRNLERHPPRSLDWIDSVRALRGHTFATSWIPNGVSVYTGTWAVAPGFGKEALIEERIHRRAPPFQTQDYFLFAERDRDTRADLYARPRYWLYYPSAFYAGTDPAGERSVKDLRASLPMLPVVAAGDDFVIFDMAPAYTPAPGP